MLHLYSKQKKKLNKIALKKDLFLLYDFSWALLIHNCNFVPVHIECKWAQIVQEEIWGRESREQKAVGQKREVHPQLDFSFSKR